MPMLSQAEIGLAEADERIAEADRNIQMIESLLPRLEINGYAALEVEHRLHLMNQALAHLREQRRAIVESLDGDEPLPLIVRRPN
jgi:hypothetical protein